MVQANRAGNLFTPILVAMLEAYDFGSEALNDRAREIALGTREISWQPVARRADALGLSSCISL